MIEQKVKERPITFSAPLVRAILAGQKTQTRRVMTPQPEYVWGWGVKLAEHDFMAHVRYPGCHPPDPWVRCPYGAPPHGEENGSRLWVREAWAVVKTLDHINAVACWQYDRPPALYYAEWTGAARNSENRGRWRSPVHMPRWASRITLEIIGIRVERLQDITEEDARAEGADRQFRTVVMSPAGVKDYHMPLSYRAGFANLWDELNNKRGYGWDSNPFIWTIAFSLLAPTRGQEG